MVWFRPFCSFLLICHHATSFFELQRHRPLTKALIFDLDSCLAAVDEGASSCSPRRLRPSAGDNDGSVPEEKLRAAFAECWRVAFDAVADKYGFTEEMRAAGWQVFRQTEVTGPIHGYGDLAVLNDLRFSGFWSRPPSLGC